MKPDREVQLNIFDLRERMCKLFPDRRTLKLLQKSVEFELRVKKEQMLFLEDGTVNIVRRVDFFQVMATQNKLKDEVLRA
jgi:hypothetical protein